MPLKRLAASASAGSVSMCMALLGGVLPILPVPPAAATSVGPVPPWSTGGALSPSAVPASPAPPGPTLSARERSEQWSRQWTRGAASGAGSTSPGSPGGGTDADGTGGPGGSGNSADTTGAAPSPGGASPGADAQGPGSRSRTTCRIRDFYEIRSHRPHSFWIPGTHFIDGPGGKMYVWVKRWHTVEARVRAHHEVLEQFNFQTFLWRARKEVVRDLARFHTVEYKHEYVRSITAGMYGHMRYRVFGHRIRFRQWHRNGDCGLRKVGSGVAIVPTTSEGWKFWETGCPRDDPRKEPKKKAKGKAKGKESGQGDPGGADRRSRDGAGARRRGSGAGARAGARGGTGGGTGTRRPAGRGGRKAARCS